MEFKSFRIEISQQTRYKSIHPHSSIRFDRLTCNIVANRKKIENFHPRHTTKTRMPMITTYIQCSNEKPDHNNQSGDGSQGSLNWKEDTKWFPFVND